MRRIALLTSAAAVLVPVAASASETVTYSYDAKGRLTVVSYSGGANNGALATYSFDGADNRTSVAVSGVSSAGAAIAADGTFEMPDLGSGFAYNPSASGATFSATSGIAGNGSAWGFLPAPDGHQVAFLQGGGASGSITLAISGMQPGRRYGAAFKAAQRPGHPAQPVIVQAQGANLGSFTPASTSFNAVATSSFVATSSSGTISFVGPGSPIDKGTAIDSVSILPVPEQPNASFEAPDQGSGFAYSPSAPGVVFTGGAGIAANGSPWGFAPAPDGHQVAFLQSAPNGVGQFVLSLANLAVGQTYRLAFQAAQRPDHGANPIVVSANGQALGTFTPASTEFQLFQTAAFYANTSSMQVTFTGSPANDDVGSAVDAITVVPVPPG